MKAEFQFTAHHKKISLVTHLSAERDHDKKNLPRGRAPLERSVILRHLVEIGIKEVNYLRNDIYQVKHFSIVFPTPFDLEINTD